ncbi:MAG TPA: hypothetical protein ENI69_06565, partial [Rhodospirillales bacterium]|nr:hypothetical protein [Rhodospirillales bacterium]
MNKAASRTPASRLYLTLALVFVAVVFVYRLTLFSGIEPRSDQAFFSWWVQGLAQADQLLPSAQSGETFLVALERDDDSFLHRLVRPIYGKSIAIFTTVPLALRLAAAWIFGDSYAVQIASSLFASALIVLVIGVLPLSAFRSRLALTAGLALFFAASASYLHYFSPWGNHNFGVLFLLIAAGATERALRALKAQSEGYGRTLLVAAALQMVALYAHWTNVFLLPTATVFCWLWADIPLRRKLIAALLYGAVLVLITLPFWLFVGLEIDR